jgi:acetyl esterase/lipase
MATYRNPTAGAALVLQRPAMHEAAVTGDVEYASQPEGPLRLDVYRPRTSSWAHTLPAVLLGGPPEFEAGKDSGQKVGWSQLLAASGLAAVAFDIRSDNFLKTPEAPSEDVASAIAFVRKRGADLGIDPDWLATLGFSIGTAPWHLWAALSEERPHIRAVATYYGLMDFSGDLGDLTMAPEKVEEYSALAHLRRRKAAVPPLLVTKAGRERFPGINESIDRFVETAEAVGADVELLLHPTGQHGFDVRDPDETSRSIIERTVAFLRRQLAP